jgi:hypothetical protein
MQRNPIESGPKVADKKEVEAKVLAYLSDCGLDTSDISVNDIDGQSLAFLSQWAENGTVVKEVKSSASLDNKMHVIHELQDLRYQNEGEVFENNSRDSRRAEIHNSDSQSQNNNEGVASFSEVDAKPITLPRAQMEIDRAKLLLSSLQSITGTKQLNQAGVAETHDVENDELDLKELEPWQRILFRKLDEQTKAIERCQNQIDALANIVIANESSTDPSATTPRGTPSSQSLHAPSAEPQTTQLPQQVQLQNDLPAPPVVTIADKVFDIPCRICAYSLSTRPIRVFVLLKREAKKFNMGNPNQPFIDIQLMMKLSFICMFLRSRIGSNARRGGGRKLDQNKKEGGGLLGEMLALWRTRSIELLVVSSIIVYFIQTGLFYFLYHVIFKDNVIAKVWRDEDLQENIDNAVGDGANLINEAGDGNALRREERRRGRRDRRPLGADDNIPGENEIQGLGQEQEQDPLFPPQHDNRPQIRPNFQPNINLDETFVGGVMDPPFHLNGDEERIRNAPREEIFLGYIIDGMKDVLYLFGSFFLSFFPMWRPRVREVVEENRNPKQELIRGGEVPQETQDDTDENDADGTPDDDVDGGADEQQG